MLYLYVYVIRVHARVRTRVVRTYHGTRMTRVPWYRCTCVLVFQAVLRSGNVRTYVRTYTYNVMSQLVYVRTYVHVHVYHLVQVDVHVLYHWYWSTGSTNGTLVPFWYGTSTHVRTNISQKRLEIQALRCNGETSGRCQHEDITVYDSSIQLDSDVCSADLHHNPRKHVGLHAPQRLHRLRQDGLMVLNNYDKNRSRFR
jgi:hypothetical protein